MTILCECPSCHKKQSLKNKLCKCGDDLAKRKRAQAVKFWIVYKMPNGKQRKEYVGTDQALNGFSLEDAKKAHAKRLVQLAENRFMDILPESKMTFNELTDWFINLEKVKSMRYYGTLKYRLQSFNEVFGEIIVGSLKPVDLENFQAKRKTEGYADSYIDGQVGAARNMVKRAFDNDLVGGNALSPFLKIKKLLKRNSNARDRVLSGDEFESLVNALSKYTHGFHLKTIVETAYFTGMRKSEIIKLTWDKVDFKNRMIYLDAADTKDLEARNIPICKELFNILHALPSRFTGKDNYVFQHAGQPVNDFRSGLKRACKDAGIVYGRFKRGGFTFHDLRHTYNTNMRRAGVPESVIMSITGHSTREMFDRYNTIDDRDKKEAMEAFERSLDKRSCESKLGNMGNF